MTEKKTNKNKAKDIKSRKMPISQPKKTKFVLDVSWVFISSIITFIIGLIIRIILGNYFGPEGLGLYTMVLVFQVFTSIFGSIGIKSAIVKFVAEYKDNVKKLRELISCGLFNSLFLGIFVLLIIYFLSDFFGQFFGMELLGKFLRILALSFPFLFVYEYCQGIQNGLRNMKSYALVIGIEKLLWILFTIFFVILDFGVEGAIWALVISLIFTSIIQLYIIKSFIIFSIYNFKQNSKTLILFGSQLMFAGVIFLINSRVDILMIGYFLNEREVGIYAVAVMFLSAFYMLPNAIEKITYPVFSEYYGKKDYLTIEKTIDKSIKYVFQILTIIGLIIILFSKEIINLLFPTDIVFLNASVPLIILVFSGIIWGTISSIGGIFSGIGRPDIVLKTIIFIAFLNIISNVLLIPKFGINGAAIASVISFLIYAIIIIILIKKILKIQIKLKWICYSMIVIIIILSFYFLFPGILDTFSIKITLIILYLVFVYLIIFTKKDKEEILRVFKNIIGQK